jgi:hypothetical protein
MMTTLVDIEEARGRLASGERPYAFEISGHVTIVGPACGFGSDYLIYLRTQGRYAENFEEATSIANQRGEAVTGIWFIK